MDKLTAAIKIASIHCSFGYSMNNENANEMTLTHNKDDELQILFFLFMEHSKE